MDCDGSLSKEPEELPSSPNERQELITNEDTLKSSTEISKDIDITADPGKSIVDQSSNDLVGNNSKLEEGTNNIILIEVPNISCTDINPLSTQHEFICPGVPNVHTENSAILVDLTSAVSTNIGGDKKTEQSSGDNKEASLNLEEMFYTTDTEPQWYDVKGNLVTRPIITGNLPKVYESLPITGKPEDKDDMGDFHMKKIREFVGCNLEDDEFNELAKYCSPLHLEIGKELIMPTNMPTVGYIPETIVKNDSTDESGSDEDVQELRTMTKSRKRDVDLEFRKKLKYRGVRLMSLAEQEERGKADNATRISDDPEEDARPLEPGKDILYRVRVYRPFNYTPNMERNIKVRHSVFSCDIMVLGRQKLTALRDRIVCYNEADMRVDVSNTPDDLPMTTAKEVFPSGFMFINNVFYVDTRAGCADHSAGLRRWARARRLGTFRRRDMSRVALHTLPLKLGYPEVYVHQGNCEHLFTFSEVRLLGPNDPLTPSCYPCHTAISQNQSIYCTTCAEFSAKWVVIGCNRVPFDPAFFCDTCFKPYLYKDGQKICDFKAFTYRGNEMNILKPLS